jgi:hypothetical protein
MSSDYDNTNRGAGWAIPDKTARATRRVNANIGGHEYRGYIIRTGAPANAPTHNLWLQSVERRSEVYCVAIFEKEGGGKKLAGGEITLRSGGAYWVSLFANTNENPKSPKIDISFQPKEARPQDEGYFQQDVQPDDDILF